ncbi:hypothetical protein BBK14_33890 [Parafrankia soli]|uniref:Uncharacterized protein n=2 Tax=Parafrankia soli TaxID=2599596 RepID=A0A1S1QD18_9ACTN|nr:hypothetical protein BBK14_33890 [Parafrankia soli]
MAGRHVMSTCADRPVYFTIAQLARRVGLSDGRVRALWATQRASLPIPDALDADQRPLWLASTIEAWWALRKRPASELAATLMAKASPGSPEDAWLREQVGELTGGRTA